MGGGGVSKVYIQGCRKKGKWMASEASEGISQAKYSSIFPLGGRISIIKSSHICHRKL